VAKLPELLSRIAPSRNYSICGIARRLGASGRSRTNVEAHILATFAGYKMTCLPSRRFLIHRNRRIAARQHRGIAAVPITLFRKRLSIDIW
jgi:hypothetical protein